MDLLCQELVRLYKSVFEEPEARGKGVFGVKSPMSTKTGTCDKELGLYDKKVPHFFQVRNGS